MSRSSKSSHKHSSSRAKGASSANQHHRMSFLFIVNKLQIREPERDVYGQYIPPTNPHMYEAEVPSKVMRYCNGGDISDTLGYLWYRDPGTVPNGQLWRSNAAGEWIIDESTGYYVAALEYKTFAVAACNPLLPIMVVKGDPLINPTGGWELLRIFHPRQALAGLSQVVTLESHGMGPGGGPVRYVAGRGPSWMPGLLPRTYRSPMTSAPMSCGLGGELPIILGLMALSADKDENNAFACDEIRRKWQRGLWTSSESAKGYPETAEDDPRCFLVKVFLDPENPYGSTVDALHRFEWEGSVVREPS
ncbi:hypothetical protein FZEAL_8951 [Fusarium zealandicum]|uniref:Uncharacterized protein n=1 Tax=Fusarium zealandicum TaxID=1053134 RepID=A0A8H4XHC3_9HYPO|nr:hypothetical protein FZEAL_8951 [Fusarium zealandicum]